MIEQQDNFIRSYSNVTPMGYCQHMIAEFERLRTTGIGTNRIDAEGAAPHAKQDYAMFLERGAATAFSHFEDRPVLDYFFNATQDCFNEYTTQYSVLRDSPISGFTAKMQCTSPGGGYHIWHGEQSGGINAARVLTYMLYLNTLEPQEGGETEFLYQKLRIRPEENMMLVWPAAFTHAHRGNTVLGVRSKYVITGWFYYN